MRPKRTPSLRPVPAPSIGRTHLVVGVILALAYLAALVVVDLALPSHYVLIEYYGVAAVIAASTLEWRLTFLIGLGAVLAGLIVAAVDHGSLDTTDVALRIGSVGATSLTATVVAAIRERRERRLAAVTEVAEVAEHAIFRSVPISLPDLEVATIYRSASNVASVGGDLYEAVWTPYGSRLIIGDARGKGLPAVQMAAVVLGAFRHAALSEPDLERLVTDLDRTVAAFATEEDFVTALIIEVADLEVRLVCCGHPWPLIGPPGYVRPVSVEPLLPLGLGGPRPVQVRGFPTRQILVAYTDGLVEAKNREGDMMVIESLASSIRSWEPLEVLKEIETKVADHVQGTLSDDLTILAMKRLED
ncbi:MAG TPA: PP2C family protein-serine/threonine phosphatase [Acidimicrobiales bacterium]|nr:PP2C family protein-serine/threonine phosphatase [Acidimicrobiales bacterium]